MKKSSQAEQSYIQAGCALGIRYDGRGMDDFRAITIQNNIFPHVNGSSRVKIDSDVDIICSVKLEIADTLPSAPSSGYLAVNVDISPSCAIYTDEKSVQATSSSIAEHLEGMFVGSNALDLKQFSILKGKFCWVVHVDLLILSMDGNPLDACSIAAQVALQCTRIPRTEAIPGESGLLEDFEVIGDLAESTFVQAQGVPVFVTVAKVGSALLLDSSAAEQQCASCVLGVAVDRDGACCGVQYLKHGLLANTDLSSCIQRATQAAAGIFQHLEKFNISMANAKGGTASASAAAPDAPFERLGLLV
mmetsp:Transcript_14095/g.24826  ORF Transcript_14095/g.24826 Transcript_14095/m.24826 type:complete len:304 (-) Transcript_14095:65-976(-)